MSKHQQGRLPCSKSYSESSNIVGSLVVLIRAASHKRSGTSMCHSRAVAGRGARCMERGGGGCSRSGPICQPCQRFSRGGSEGRPRLWRTAAAGTATAAALRGTLIWQSDRERFCNMRAHVHFPLDMSLAHKQSSVWC